MPDVITCHCCGKVLGPDNLSWDFAYPDVLAYLSEDERAEVIRFENRVFVAAEGYGVATRVILPIRLDSGFTATLGVWLGLADSGEAERIDDAAHEGGATWVGFTFAGTLLNEVRPWPEIAGAPATATGLVDGEIAQLSDSSDPVLKRVLTETWPHHDFLRAQPFLAEDGLQ